MRPLPKHLRPRYRYLAVSIESWPDADLDRRSVQGALWTAARRLLGDAGSADVDLRIIRFRFTGGEGDMIVRTTHEHVEPARAAIACVDRVADEPVGLAVWGISGTVRACKEKHMRARQKAGSEKRVVFGNAARTAIQRADRVDVRTDDAFTGATTLDLE
ncbi:MAG: Rpp14/Pop5 family protein [Halobacteriales archaeon]